MKKLMFFLYALLAGAPAPAMAPQVHFREVQVQGLRIAYREAGPTNGPVLLLLHGFPSSSHYFRTLMPLLADHYHLVAPDMPGFGFSEAPPSKDFAYTFVHLTEVIDAFTAALGLHKYAIYVFDYGAPVGFRLAVAHPERVTAILSQNGNMYEEGLGPGWELWQRYWLEPSTENRKAMRVLLQPERLRQLYLKGCVDPSRVAPEAYTLDSALLSLPGREEAQLDLFLDYRTNIALYPAFQAYLRARKPPLLAIWGRNDPIFLPAGAEAFTRDDPKAEVRLLEAGHFALETDAEPIADAIRGYLQKTLNS
ncbi:MAG: alpha/beta hydrolase [Holophaga sp.]|nr:alpha/beta hydrolase [Holophaga sp.]